MGKQTGIPPSTASLWQTWALPVIALGGLAWLASAALPPAGVIQDPQGVPDPVEPVTWEEELARNPEAGDPQEGPLQEGPGQDGPVQDGEVEAIGSDDSAAEAALAEAQLALEYAPFDPVQLAATARLARDLELDDEALWYTHLALEHLPLQGNQELRESLLDLRKEVGLLGPPLEALQEEFSRGLFEMARSCERKNLYANAADLLQRCSGTAMEERAEERLAKLFGRRKAVQGLLASGVPIDIPVRRKINAKKKRRVDRKHTTWEKAYEVKAKYYHIKSDMGYDFTHAFAEAMDQINGFYREVFRYKTRGQDMRTCKIHVYKSRAEFDRHEGMADRPTTKGFFQPGENRVVTYDQRTDGGSLGSLWSTLFHEASHQFTEILAPDLKLTWLNEGTACYFEGAYLQPGGHVATNRIPDSRLRGLKRSLDREALTLRQVVTYYQDGSYPGEYYAFGWGLVYFFHNYEDEASKRRYLPLYRDFFKAYRSNEQHDVLERFVEYFVTKAEVDGVTTFEEFDAHWQAWIQSLHDLHFGGPEQADVLLKRARKQQDDGQLTYARESLEWALEKNPEHTDARLELAQVLQELEAFDASLYHWRQLEATARAAGGEAKTLPHSKHSAAQVLERAHNNIATLHPGYAELLTASLESLVEQSLDNAERYDHRDMPLTAMQFLRQADRLVGGDARLRQALLDIQSSFDQRMVRGYRPATDAELSGWTRREGWAGDGQRLTGSSPYASALLYESAPTLPYRVEAQVSLPEGVDDAYVGLLFAADLGSETLLAWQPKDMRVSHIELHQEGQRARMSYPVRPPKGQSGPPSQRTVHLAVEVNPFELRFFTNGRMVGKHKLRGDSAEGRIGLFVQGSSAIFEDVRMEY